MCEYYVLFEGVGGGFPQAFPQYRGKRRWPAEVSMKMLFVAGMLGCGVLAAQSSGDPKLAPYYPTPETIVEKMLQLGGLKAGEKVYDLGSGDGRIVIMAAQKDRKSTRLNSSH